MEETKKIFTNQALRALIFPLIMEQVLAISVGMVGTIMISYAGESAISGVSLVDMINNLIINLFAALATGGAVIISQYIGKKDQKTASDAANQLLLITSMISIGVMGFVLLLKVPLLKLLFGAIDQDVMNNALIYLTISAFSYPFIAVFNSCAALFRSMGNSKVSMNVSIGMNVLNVAGNALLIYVLKKGVAGSAFASFFARAVAAVVMLVLLQNGTYLIHVEWKKVFSWNSALIRKIIRIALPNGIENGLFQLGRVLVVSIIAGFGTAQIAANAVANSLDSVGAITCQAISLAMITVVGQCMGAGDKEQAVSNIKKMLRMAYLFTAVVNSILLLSLPLIMNLFTLSPEARSLTIILVWIHNGVAIFLWPIAFSLPNALRAAGDVKYTMYVAIFAMLAFRIVFSVILGIYFGWGAIGVWVAMIMDWIFRSIFYVVRFKKGKWKSIQVV